MTEYSRAKGFSQSEVLMTLGLIGILAVTMVGLNNLGDNKFQVNSTKLAQAEVAIKTWGKAVSKSNETGLGILTIVENETTLTNSLASELNIQNSNNNNRYIWYEIKSNI